ncbi:hypothetical protein GYMLUDRAFT_38691 [Collybiopsis luxurians FD-317 M1]|nr:hypothetical protein GYMLUDRAFT_38691 [Collybiopsis luxurians FD-317 M1]
MSIVDIVEVALTCCNLCGDLLVLLMMLFKKYYQKFILIVRLIFPVSTNVNCHSSDEPVGTEVSKGLQNLYFIHRPKAVMMLRYASPPSRLRSAHLGLIYVCG